MKNALTTFIISCCITTSLNAQWTQVGSSINGDNEDDRFGSSVGINDAGNIVAVGGFMASGQSVQAGRVRVFQYINSDWIQLGQDLTGESAHNLFGAALDLNALGDILAIGATGHDSWRGHVKVYKNVGGSWIQLGADIDGETTTDRSGSSVSLSADGHTIAIGSPGYGGAGIAPGYTRIFRFNGINWIQIGDPIHAVSNVDLCGSSVSLSADGNSVAIGSPYYENNGVSTTGLVRVFSLEDNSWVIKGDPLYGITEDENFGFDLELSDDGNTLVVGGPNHEENGVNYGYARVFSFENASWTQKGSNLNGTVESERFGDRVSISNNGNRIAVSSPRFNGSLIGQGRVGIYEHNGSDWVQVEQDIFGAQLAYLGSQVDLNHDGSTIVVGAQSSGLFDEGKVHVFTIAENFSLEETGHREYQVYPNPSEGVVFINNSSEYSVKSIAVYNTLGQQVYVNNTIDPQDIHTIDLTQLRSGVYTIQIRNENSEVKTRKIVLK